MPQHDIQRGDAADLRRLDILFTLQAQRLATHDTRHIQPRYHADGDKDQQDILTKKGHQQDNEEHKWKGVEDLQQTHHHRVGFTAQIACQRAVQRTHYYRHQRGGDADHQRDTPADRHAHQQIAA